MNKVNKEVYKILIFYYPYNITKIYINSGFYGCWVLEDNINSYIFKKILI